MIGRSRYFHEAYYCDITKVQAVEKLRRTEIEGTYLFRDSEAKQGDITLSVL